MLLLPGFAVFTLSALRQAYTSAKQRTQAAVEPLRSVTIGDGGISFLKIGLADKVVIASGPALEGGIGVWRLKSLVDGSSVRALSNVLCNSTISTADLVYPPFT